MKILISLSRTNWHWADAFNTKVLLDAKKEAMAFKSRTCLVLMQPSRFLSLAEGVDFKESTKTKAVQNLFDKGIKFSDIPYLITKPLGGYLYKVTGHEGRHRAKVLMDSDDSKLMPVRVTDKMTRWQEDGHFGSNLLFQAQGSTTSFMVKIPARK